MNGGKEGGRGEEGREMEGRERRRKREGREGRERRREGGRKGRGRKGKGGGREGGEEREERKVSWFQSLLGYISYPLLSFSGILPFGYADSAGLAGGGQNTRHHGALPGQVPRVAGPREV